MKMTEERRKIWLVVTCLILVYISWGSCYISIKFALESFPPFYLCGIRMTLAGVILYTALRLMGRKECPTFTDLRRCFLLGFFMVFVSSGFLCLGQKTVPSGVAGLFAGMVPIWMVVGGWLLLHEDRPGLMQAIGLGGGTLGILLLSMEHGMSGIASWWGPVFLLTGTLGVVAGSFYSKLRAGQSRLSLMQISALIMFMGGVQSFLGALALGETVELGAVSPESWWALASLVLFSGIVAYSGYFWLLMNTRTEVAVSFEYVDPLIGVFLGWWLGGEELTGVVLSACALIVVSVFFVISGQRR